MPRHESQGTYNDRPVIVAMGYDIQLQGWFMTVTPVEEDNPDADEETGMIYSNLDDPELNATLGFTQDMDYFRRKLREMKIVVGDRFFATVMAVCD